MNKDLNDLLILDEKIGDFYYENKELSDKEFMIKLNNSTYLDKALKLINKLSNKNILELLRRSEYIKKLIDLKKFIKEYPINKSLLKSNNEMYIEEYKKLQKTCLMISDFVRDYHEFQEYMDALKVDNVESYLLENMPNEQIYTLANETSFWDEKLYLFSFFKQEKKKTTG